jgi:hypothetical protein
VVCFHFHSCCASSCISLPTLKPIATMSFSSNQSDEKKRTFLEVIDISSDEDDDDLLAHTGPIFTKKTKTPDGAPSSSASSAFSSDKDLKPPAKVESSYPTPKLFPEVSSSSPDYVGSNSTTPLLVKSSRAVPVTVESSTTSPFPIGSSSPSQDEPPLLKVESSYAKKPMPAASLSSVKPEPVVSTALRNAAGSESTSSPSSTPIASSSLPDVKPAALSTLTPMGYVTFPMQDIKGSTATTTMMTMGQRLTMSQPHEGSIGLYDGSTKANVGSIDKRYAQHIVPLLSDHAATISMQCTVAQCLPGLTILVRIEVYFKAPGLGPPPAALLQTSQAELQTKLQKVGWTPGTAPPIHRNFMGASHLGVAAGSSRGVTPTIPHHAATTSAAVDNPLHNNQERVFDDDTEDQGQLEETEQGQDQYESSFGKVDFEDFLGPVAYASEKEVEIDVEKLDKVFDALQTQQLSDLPQVAMPKHLSSVKFYKYQEDGVRWLLKQEQQERIPPWFVDRSSGHCTKWVCQITGAIQLEKPGLVRGSVLADDMVR